jgi:N-acetylmuramoyl-L-alanine amidase
MTSTTNTSRLPAGYEPSQQDIDSLARTIWAEARGEGAAGMEAVAHVIINRLAKPSWWSRGVGGGVPDDTIAAVCRKPWQFSCWNDNDPNRTKLQRVTVADGAFARAWAIARAVLDGDGAMATDPTGGATHYHVFNIRPQWADGATACASIGRHRFYRGIS